MGIPYLYVKGLVDRIERAAANLVVDTADVFAQYPHGGELHPAHKQHQHGNCRNAHRIVIAVEDLEYDDNTMDGAGTGAMAKPAHIIIYNGNVENPNRPLKPIFRDPR
jgi:hypothetical protein